MQWDLLMTLSPESPHHQVTMLMGDHHVPKSWRHMNIVIQAILYMWVQRQRSEV